MTEHEKFVDRHIEMLLADDLDDVMNDYQPDVVLRAGGHDYKGVDAVRSHLEAALASAPGDARLDYAIDTRNDGQVTLTWRLFTAASTEPVLRGHDVFRIRRGTHRRAGCRDRGLDMSRGLLECRAGREGCNVHHRHRSGPATSEDVSELSARCSLLDGDDRVRRRR